jgi:nucleotide-binding universal stress UspA family protein
MVRRRLEEARRRDGLRSDIRELPFESGASSAIAYASYTDVVMLAQPSPRQSENHPYGWSTEEIVREARVPTIIVPAALLNEYTGDRVLVAWNASSESHRAVADAMPFLEMAKTVEVLTVDAKIGARSHGDEPGADIARHLAKHNVHVEVSRLETSGKSISETILDRAGKIAADLVVAGAYGRSRTSELLLGSTTHDLLMRTRWPLLLSR